MGPEVWLPVLTTLLGAGAAGGLSLLNQRQSQRGADRADLLRTSVALAEARRAERITHVLAFLEAVQTSERVAVDHHHHGIDDEDWHERADMMIDRLWMLQKTLHLVCSTEVNDAAREVAFTMRRIIRKGPADRRPPLEQRVWEELSPSRMVFLDLARDELGTPDS